MIASLTSHLKTKSCGGIICMYCKTHLCVTFYNIHNTKLYKNHHILFMQLS